MGNDMYRFQTRFAETPDMIGNSILQKKEIVAEEINDVYNLTFKQLDD